MSAVWAALEPWTKNPQARSWAEELGDDLLTAWDKCPRGDWQMMLAIGRPAEPLALARGAVAAARVAVNRTESEDLLDVALVEANGFVLSPEGQAQLDALSQAEDDTRAAAGKALEGAIQAGVAALDGKIDAPKLMEVLSSALAAITFIEMGPKAHRALARAVREGVGAA